MGVKFVLKPNKPTKSEQLFFKNLRVCIRKQTKLHELPKHPNFYTVVNWYGSTKVFTVFDKKKFIPVARLEAFLPVVSDSIQLIA